MASGDGGENDGPRKGVRYFALRFLAFACGLFVFYLIGSPALDYLIQVPFQEWSIGSYIRSVENEENFASATTEILELIGICVIVLLARKIAWHLDFPARFRDRVRELDRDPPEPKP
jgi:hypothetical protein